MHRVWKAHSDFSMAASAEHCSRWLSTRVWPELSHWDYEGSFSSIPAAFCYPATSFPSTPSACEDQTPWGGRGPLDGPGAAHVRSFIPNPSHRVLVARRGERGEERPSAGLPCRRRTTCWLVWQVCRVAERAGRRVLGSERLQFFQGRVAWWDMHYPVTLTMAACRGELRLFLREINESRQISEALRTDRYPRQWNVTSVSRHMPQITEDVSNISYFHHLLTIVSFSGLLSPRSSGLRFPVSRLPSSSLLSGPRRQLVLTQYWIRASYQKWDGAASVESTRGILAPP